MQPARSVLGGEAHVDLSEPPAEPPNEPEAEGGGQGGGRGGGKFGKLGGGGKAQTAEARAKLASWSESGGVREAAFKKPRSVPIE